MKPIALLFLIAAFCSGVPSCAFVPVNNHYEKAGTLKQGGVELSGHFTGNGAVGGGGAETINNNLGFRAGVGVSDRVDLKFRYERLTPANADGSSEIFDDYDDFKGANYFSIIPKVVLVPEVFSLLVPISHYSYRSVDEDAGSLSSIAPQLLYTFTNPKKTSDLTIGCRADFLFGGGGGGVIPGITLGAGISSDLNKWSVRPEVAASFLGGGAFISYGIGIQFILPKPAAAKR